MGTRTTAMMLTVLLALGGTALADEDLAAEIRALRDTVSQQGAALEAQSQEIQQLRSAAGENWLNERRAEEVKALIADVLSDADTRASLLDDGLTAGHDGEHFFLGSASGDFLLVVSGLVQGRYTYVNRNGDRDNRDYPLVNTDFGASTFDQNEAGFDIPRAKVQFAGHIASPRLTYAVRLAVDSATNDVWADKITIGYQLMENLWIGGGEDKGPFLREELIEPEYQLAVDRSLVNEFFTGGRIQGIWATWHPVENVHTKVALSDGFRSGERQGMYFEESAFTGSFGSLDPEDVVYGSKRFDKDDSDFAITARVDVKVMGKWEQMMDFTAWADEPTGIFVGGALHWESRETGDSIGDAAGGALFGHTYDMLAWTVDVSAECNRSNVFLAVVGADFYPEGTLTDPTNPDPFGVVLQGGYQIIPDQLEAFIRWEYMDLDVRPATTHLGTDKDDEINILTAGANWYMNRHKAKFTVDVVWALDPIHHQHQRHLTNA